MADFIQVKDANNKEFDIDVSKVSDINGDFGVKDGTITDSVLKNRIPFEHDMKLVDLQGNALDSAQLLHDMESGKTSIPAIDVEMEATHSGKNHNYCIYYEDSMEKDAESFMNPFKKPVLHNHDSYSEPMGRVTQAYTGPSELTDERAAIHLKARVTDKDAIPKFIDKRYGTVSIGGSMGTVQCNICGKTILKDGKFHFCGHMRGETYKDQICYWGARDIEYHEVSVVNNPADDFAQIMKVTVLTDKDLENDSNQKKEEHDMSDNKPNVDDIIDSTLNAGSDTKDSNQTPEQKAEETKPEAQDSQKDTNPEGKKPEENTDSATDNSKVTEEKDAKITELTNQLEDANNKISQFETDAIDAQSQIDTLKKQLEDAQKDATMFRDRCVALATANKEAIVDKLVAKETFETDEAKDARKKDLMTKSMKELKAMETSDSTPAQRQQASVSSPVLANNDDNTADSKDSNSNDKVADANNKDSQDIKTVDDAVQDIINRLVH